MSDLAGFRGDAAHAGVFCDFDGSLSLIVEHFADARMIPGASRVLSALSKRYAVVAVVSGRSVRDLSKRVRSKGVHLVGTHGLEEMRDGELIVSAEAESFRRSVSDAVDALGIALRGMRGVAIENKGLAVAVHVRTAADPDATYREAQPVAERVASDHGLDLVTGRRVLELRPPAGGDKGTAVTALLQRYGLRRALYAGDGTTDLAGFRALDDLSSAIRVAVASGEGPSELIERADLVVGSPQELLALLRKL